VGPAEYFNSGVMLLDLAALRDFASFERIREFARAAPVTLILPEQDATCAVLGGHRLPLHPRWNLMNGLIHLCQAETIFEPVALAEARERPAIRHFEGSANKPWQLTAPETDREQWARYAGRVPAALFAEARGRG
jgi:lipopolysaccharide biosynthesis glycosyltransferase